MARPFCTALVAAVGAALVASTVGPGANLAAAAEPAPLVVMPFSARCFDASGLVAAVRKRVPGVSVSVGVARLGRQRARVHEERGLLTVELEARDDRGRLLASERRILPAPADEDCSALLDLVSLVVARAAVPLESAALPPLPPPAETAVAPPHERPVDHPRPRSPIAKPSELAPAPSTEAPVAETPHVDEPAETVPTIRPSLAPQPRTAVVTPAHPYVEPPVATSPPAPRVPWPGPASSLLRRRLQLSATFAWLFAVDSGSAARSVPAGMVSIDYRLRWWGVALHLGVTDEFSASAKSTAVPSGSVGVDARRLPLALALHLDLPLWPLAGRLSLGAGPELLIWLTHTDGLLHNGSHAFVEPALQFRAAYQVERGRFSFTLGAQSDVALITDALAVGGVGTLVHTPRVVLGPFVALGLALH